MLLQKGVLWSFDLFWFSGVKFCHFPLEVEVLDPLKKALTGPETVLTSPTSSTKHNSFCLRASFHQFSVSEILNEYDLLIAFMNQTLQDLLSSQLASL